MKLPCAESLPEYRSSLARLRAALIASIAAVACSDSQDHSMSNAKDPRGVPATTSAVAKTSDTERAKAPDPATDAAPAIVGAWSGATTKWSSDDGALAAELRQGWTIAATEPGRVLVNPGLQETDTLDCLLVVVWGELEPSQHALDAAGIMQAQDEELRAELRAQQVDLQRAKSPPMRLDAGGRDAAEQVYEGRAAGNKVRTWVGTTLQDGWHATVVAVVVIGREERFLPGAKRLLSSARLAAPKRDAQAEARLAGAEYAGQQDFGPGGAISVVYRLERDGGVVRTSLVSGSFGIDGAVGGESRKQGRWTSDGQRVRMRFDDGVEEGVVEGAGARVLVVGRMRCQRR